MGPRAHRQRDSFTFVPPKADSLEDLRSSRLRPFFGELLVGQWNVEELTDLNVVQLQLIMERRGIGILCMQETHKHNSDYY